MQNERRKYVNNLRAVSFDIRFFFVDAAAVAAAVAVAFVRFHLAAAQFFSSSIY